MPGAKLIKTAATMFAVQYNFSVPAVFELLLLDRYDSLRPWVTGSLDGSIFVGAIIGMLTMGYLGDAIGRSPAYAITLGIAAVGVLASALTSFGSMLTVYIVLIITRFIVGIGLGGSYPLSGAENFEDAGGRDGSVQSAWALFWQTPGQIAPYLLGYLLSFGPITTSDSYEEMAIHLVIGLGALPLLLVLPMALRQEDSAVFQKRDESAAVTNVCDSLGVMIDPRYRVKLFGTAMSWCLFNFVSYGISLYSPFILADIFEQDSFRAEMVQNMICCVVCIPACVLTILLIKPLEPRTLQMVGFAFMAFIYALLALMWGYNVSRSLLFIVFITARFSIWFGPVATVFLLPSEIFPTAIRTSCVGISAAFGKVGAILGVFLIPVFEPAIGISAVFVICAGVALLAIAVTHVCIPEDTLASGADEADKLGEAPVSGPTPAAEAPAAEAPAPSEDTGLLEEPTR